MSPADTGARDADHHSFEVAPASEAEPAHPDAAQPLARSHTEQTDTQAVDVGGARDRQAEREAAHEARPAAVVWRPDRDVHAVDTLQISVAEVEPEPDDARHVADGDADVIDGEVDPLGEGGERREERQRCGAERGAGRGAERGRSAAR